MSDRKKNHQTRIARRGRRLWIGGRFPMAFGAALVAVLALASGTINGQLPDDIQRELNQNLAEQARIQALRQQHQRQIQARTQQQPQQQQQAAVGRTQQQPKHDPNNYSYQQVSPPVQYSYYQPFGDAAAPPAQQAGQGQAAAARQQQPTAADLDLNNLNFDLPQPQAQVAASRQAGNQQQYTPSFTGVGGLPVMKPIGQPPAVQAAAIDNSFAPAGNAPLAPQARVQQGPPLTEADFKDITGGENYGAPGGNDFGLGDGQTAAAGGEAGNNGRADNTDDQLREFGMPSAGARQSRPAASNSQMGGGQMNIPDFGAFNPIGMAMGGGGGSNRAAARPRSDPSAEFGNFDGFAGPASGNSGASGGGGGGNAPASEFDFASQPSSARGDQAAQTVGGGAPGSLQSLLGSGFPGLGGNSQSGLDDFASGSNDPQSAQMSGNQQQRTDDGALDVANLGDKSDQFSGADLGGFEQPSPQSDQDFNYAAASGQQPTSVPYPDGNPQPVGTLLALTQPQSLSQTRYNAMPDKGTYQDYPAYLDSGNGLSNVAEIVDNTPAARKPGQGRYGMPSRNALAPEHRIAGDQQFDYSRGPTSSVAESGYHYE